MKNKRTLISRYEAKHIKNKPHDSEGITLVALVVTIVVLLILAGITVTMLFGENGIIKKAQEAKEATERDKLATEQGMQDLVDQMSTILNGAGSGETDDGKMAMFDTGTTVGTKIRSLVADGNIFYSDIPFNVSINGIKQYTGTPDISSMTEANIVSWTEGYELYKQNPELFAGIVPAGTELCPIYMWFEESGESEIRNIYGGIGTNDEYQKEVATGTLYWWCETSSVYLNTDSSYMFGALPYLTDISGLQNVKTDYVTNISYMFFNLINPRLTNVNALSNWNTSNVTNMSNLFTGCFSLANVDVLSNWKTSAVRDMSHMFERCRELTDISGLENWNTSSVSDMSHMFEFCEGLTDISRLENWDTSSVTDMNYMFGDCMYLTDISGLKNWNTSAVSDMSYMFGSCPYLTDISSLENWDTSAVKNMSYMFGDYETMNIMRVSDISYLSKWDVSNVEDMRSMFMGCEITDLSPLQSWNVGKVTNMRYMFYSCDKLSDASAINNWDIINVTDFSNMFSGCSTHPEFTKVTGTWDENGTFNPD